MSPLWLCYRPAIYQLFWGWRQPPGSKSTCLRKFWARNKRSPSKCNHLSISEFFFKCLCFCCYGMRFVLILRAFSFSFNASKQEFAAPFSHEKWRFITLVFMLCLLWWNWIPSTWKFPVLLFTFQFFSFPAHRCRCGISSQPSNSWMRRKDSEFQILSLNLIDLNKF